MHRLVAEIDARRWASDIERFERLKHALAVSRNEKLRGFYRRSMQEIKGRWPHHLKNEEIPA